MTKTLHIGDTIMVVSPSTSAKTLGDSMPLAKKKLESLGYHVQYGKHLEECNPFRSSSIASRVADLHAAFLDPNVTTILSAIGGFNSNELLPYLDYELIRTHPKILCGYSDITALLNAIYAKTGMTTYLGLHFSSFAMEKGFSYSLEYFHKALSNNEPYTVKPAKEWSNDAWYINQKDRTFYQNEGWKVFSHGMASGILVGGNLCTFCLLQGTPYMPNLHGKILILEETSEVYKENTRYEFNRNLTSLIQTTSFLGVKGILIGRMEIDSQVSDEDLIEILRSKKELENIPIMYNIDSSHTTPMVTLPIGGRVTMDTKNLSIIIEDM